MTDTGILIVSFGSPQKDVRARSTDVVLKEAAAQFKNCKVAEAFTGKAVRDRIFLNEGVKIPSPEEAVLKFKEEGINHLIIQNTFLMEGGEYQKLRTLAEGCKSSFLSVRAGRPLTSLSSVERFVRAFINAGIVSKEEFTCLAGHGSDFEANKMYLEIEAELKNEGYDKAVIGTLENKPDVNDVIAFLKEKKAEEVTLMPLLSVAGNHAVKDIFGEESSYLTKLCEAGFKVKCVKKGLSEYREIRELWMEAIREVL